MVEITNEQVDRLKELNEQSNKTIEELKNQNELLQKDKAKLMEDKQKAESEKEALKIQVVEYEMNKLPSGDSSELKKLKIQNENLKLSLANISSVK